MTNRPPELDTLPPEAGGPFLDEPAPLPLLETHARIPLVVREDHLDLDGQVEVSWSKGAVPGTASIKLLFRVPVERADDAAALDAVLHGSLSLFTAREEANGQKVQRTEFAATLDLVACEQADTGAVGEALRWSAPLSSLTLSVSQGVVTLTAGVRATVPISQLSAFDGLGRARCRLVGHAAQGDLFTPG